MKIKRNERISGEFQKEIYEIITRKLKNPYITEMFSISGVDVTNDLSYAKVFVSIYSTNPERKKKTFDEISSSAKTIRYELAKVMRSRTVPELHFVLDGTIEYGNKIDKILNDIKEDKNEE